MDERIRVAISDWQTNRAVFTIPTITSPYEISGFHSEKSLKTLRECKSLRFSLKFNDDLVLIISIRIITATKLPLKMSYEPPGYWRLLPHRVCPGRGLGKYTRLANKGGHPFTTPSRLSKRGKPKVPRSAPKFRENDWSGVGRHIRDSQFLAQTERPEGQEEQIDSARTVAELGRFI
ncbi:hypothetical protein HZH66_000826 [Vespula vulgaris]|uniref:Uncharacterized protein n=1 Tax=Vespula vulgaris TaxID=7454 RepID=A0A834NJ04_VESVU|nr:hypothetical protein HZH66_000826 [Vespula vulgaris]